MSYTGLMLDGRRSGEWVTSGSDTIKFHYPTNMHLTPLELPRVKTVTLRAVRVGVEGVEHWFWIYSSVEVTDEVAYVFRRLMQMATK